MLPQVLAAIDLPVIAAGGIVDGKGIANALALGASGVQMGTAFLCCPETTTSPQHRAALHSSRGEHTALTNLFSGRPARGISNRLMQELGPLSDLAPCFPYASGALALLRAVAESRGDSGFSPLWAGQDLSCCRELPPRAGGGVDKGGWAGVIVSIQEEKGASRRDAWLANCVLSHQISAVLWPRTIRISRPSVDKSVQSLLVDMNNQ